MLNWQFIESISSISSPKRFNFLGVKLAFNMEMRTLLRQNLEGFFGRLVWNIIFLFNTDKKLLLPSKIKVKLKEKLQ
jgi:hypothetical protein